MHRIISFMMIASAHTYNGVVLRYIAFKYNADNDDVLFLWYG